MTILKFFNIFRNKELLQANYVVDKVCERYQELSNTTTFDIQDMSKQLQSRYSNNNDITNDLNFLIECFCIVKRAIELNTGKILFKAQLLGSYYLYKKHVIEMLTGEGKTLSAIIPAYIYALSGKGSVIVTANEYLAKRDAKNVSGIFECLNMRCAYISSSMSFEDKRSAYKADILYTQGSEIIFDYLRNNLAINKDNVMRQSMHFCIIDEADAILIDEARMPISISAPKADDNKILYKIIYKYIKTLDENTDIERPQDSPTIHITDHGMKKLEKLLNINSIISGSIYENDNMNVIGIMHQLVKARFLYVNGKEYIVKNGAVVLVDEFTGRLSEGRRLGNGLHQALEAKEGVTIQDENTTIASITYQSYFKLYKNISGMTGTADTEKREFKAIYNLDVRCIKTNLPMIRQDMNDKVYINKKAKYSAIVALIKERHAKGQPILIGTTSIERSEEISRLLKSNGIKHRLLNAKNHEEEADIIQYAGVFGAITVATNMAGRGVDIMLGGPDGNIANKEKVISTGGLLIIGSERYYSRRIDNQLRGRSGRQGDPGESIFYLSLEDDLIKTFVSKKAIDFMITISKQEDIPIEHKIIDKSILNAQKRIDAQNFSTRKFLIEYDMVNERQRAKMYDLRSAFLYSNKEDLVHNSLYLLDKFVDSILTRYDNSSDLNIYLKTTANIDASISSDADNVGYEIQTRIVKILADNIEELNEELGNNVKMVILKILDYSWQAYLGLTYDLRRSVGFRVYGNSNPINTYKKHSMLYFNDGLAVAGERIVNYIALKLWNSEYNNSQRSNNSAQVKLESQEAKIGRNDKCHCGSGKKYKKCHGISVQES